MKSALWFLALTFSLTVQAKTFQNSYVAFEVPDDWNCLQEGVAWTCTPRDPVATREAVIVLAAKVAGPEDNLTSFLNYLKQPKKITTRVGTPMPSKVMYAQQRQLAGSEWVQSQHLGSEVQDYYTLYLATVKQQLSILVSFSSESSKYKTYNPVFDRAMKTLRITANQQLLIPKSKRTGSSEVIGINVDPNVLSDVDMLPPPDKKPAGSLFLLVGIGVLAAAVGGAVMFLRKRRKISHLKTSKPRTK